MTDKEIKELAKKRLKANGGDCISLMIVMFAFLIFVFLFEISTYLILKEVGLGKIFHLNYILANKSVMCYWVIKLFLFFVILMPEFAIIKRQFIDVSRGENFIETRQYISAHSREYYRRSLKSAFIYNMIKLFVAVPIFIGIYGIYYWGWVCKLNELTSMGLFFFMLSVGFTVVWIGVFGHYCMSLALTPYIMSLNPKANIFDACDLSVRLMDGHHYRYAMFLLSFCIYIPTIVFIYPVFAIYPYFQICYTVLMEEILGEYWQDKMPAMIKRWKKYL